MFFAHSINQTLKGIVSLLKIGGIWLNNALDSSPIYFSLVSAPTSMLTSLKLHPFPPSNFSSSVTTLPLPRPCPSFDLPFLISSLSGPPAQASHSYLSPVPLLVLIPDLSQAHPSNPDIRTAKPAPLPGIHSYHSWSCLGPSSLETLSSF